MTVENVAFVVIGRNEGERLRNSLQPLLEMTPQVVYVDLRQPMQACFWRES